MSSGVVFVTLTLYFKTERNFELSFRHAFFQVVSQITCTGYATSDYMAFPSIGMFFMFLIMFSGGSTGSTTGGIKIARHLVSMKNLRNTFIRIHHPNAVIPIRLNGRIVPEGYANQMTVFILLYLIIFATGNIIMQLTGISIIEASGASIVSGRHRPRAWGLRQYGQLCSFQQHRQDHNDAPDADRPTRAVYLPDHLHKDIQEKLTMPPSRIAPRQ